MHTKRIRWTWSKIYRCVHGCNLITKIELNVSQFFTTLFIRTYTITTLKSLIEYEKSVRILIIHGFKTFSIYIYFRNRFSFCFFFFWIRIKYSTRNMIHSKCIESNRLKKNLYRYIYNI